MAETKPRWTIQTDDEIPYMKCTNCNHKISVKDFIFADFEYDTCPFCNTKLDLSNIEEETLMELVISSEV